MAGDYKVSIELAAKVSDYNRGMELAAKTTRRLQDAQQGVARSSSDAADSLTRAGSAAERSAGGLKSMTKEVRSLERAQRKLNDTNAKSANSPMSGGLPNLGAVLPDPAKFKAAGTESGKLFASGLQGSLATPILGPVLIGSLVAVAAVAAPAAGAAIGGGIIAGLGSAAIGAGVAASLRSPVIQGAVDSLKAELGTLADGIGKDFETEVMYSVQLLRGSVKEIGPDLRTALAPAAGYLKPLTLGFEGLIKNALPGLTEGIKDAAPVFDVIADQLPHLGDAVGDLFSTIGDNANEIASGVQLVLFIVEELVDAGAGFIAWLSEAYVATLKIGIALTTWGSLLPGVGGLMHDAGVDLRDALAVAEGGGDGVGAAFNKIGDGLKYGADASDVFITRQKILNGSMHEGIEAAGGLAEALRVLNGGAVDAEGAEIAYQAAIDGVTKSIKDNGRSLDDHTPKGRANLESLRAIRKATEDNVKVAYDNAAAKGTVADAEVAGAAAAERGRKQLIASYLQFDNNKARAKAYADQILKIPPSWKTVVSAETASAITKIEALGFKVEQLPDGTFKVTAKTKDAEAAVARAQALLDGLTSKTVTVTVRTNLPNGNIHVSGVGGSGTQLKRWGGIDSPAVAMASGGITQAGIYPASNPPLVRFAEPETGGEGYVPKNGDRRRNLAIMSEMAKWPSVNAQIVPMANGGVLAARSGALVNFAPTSNPLTGSRLDSMSGYIGARDAVVSLNKALKENGRALSLNTSKGRANRSELISGITAAKSAAEAKYNETGSIKAANIAYAEHINRLKRVLAQQRISASTISSLMKQLSARPDYGITPAAPTNSLANIAFAKSAAGVQDQLGSLQDTLSLNLPSTSLNSASSRESLLGVIGFLEAAGSAVQDRFAQTGSSKAANTLYKTYLAALQKALASAGFTKAAADALIKTYGRITLQPNAAGGVYGSMGQAMALGPGSTLYGFREPSTGGEAFIPKHGDRQRSERILQIAAGWQGGTYQPRGSTGGGGGGGSTHTSHMTVNNYGEAMTVAKHQQVQRQADVRTRVTRPR